MKRFIPYLIIIAGWLSTAPSVALAEIPLTDYNALRNVEVKRSGQELFLQFQFKKTLTDFDGPTFFKRSVQMDFPMTYVDPPKRYFPVGESGISQIYVSQFDRELMRIRFILDESESVTRNMFHYEIQGSQLTVRIEPGNGFGRNSAASSRKPGPSYDETLDRLLERTVTPVIKKSTSPDVVTREDGPDSVSKISRVIDSARNKIQPARREALEPVSRLKEAPGGIVKQEKPENSKWRLKDQKKNKGIKGKESEGSPEVDGLLGTAVTMIATLAFVIGLMFLIFHLFKKFVMKEGGFGGSDKPIRVLSTGFLGPKKSIALVEVAGRVLVLGVANEQISLLSALDNDEEIKKLLSKHNKEKGGVKNTGKKTVSKGEVPASPVTQPPLEEEDEIYTRRARPADKTEFSKQIKEFENKNPGRNRSVDEVARMIRKQRSKVGV